MSGIDSIQFADIARQRTDQSARAAARYTQRHAADAPSTRRKVPARHWRLHWHHPARAGIVGS